MTDEFDLRRSLGRFATGVTVITCDDALGRPCGITANSFSSVSLNPPLVLWNIAKVSNSLEAYLNADRYSINVLAADQRDLAVHFAKSDHTLFERISYDKNQHGVPVLPATIACFDCRTQQIHDCGDHFIIVGEVEEYRASDQTPLLFFGG
ncbi:MAG: flavin reductase family protein, partial [Woeseia sp.]